MQTPWQKRKAEIRNKLEQVNVKNILKRRHKQRLYVALYWGPGDSQREDFDQMVRPDLEPTQDPEPDERK